MWKPFLRRCVPDLHPAYWVIVNGLCLSWSLYLLLLILLNHPKSEYFVRKYYFCYNLVTSGAWVFEAVLNLAYHSGYLSSKDEGPPRQTQSSPDDEKLSASDDNGTSSQKFLLQGKETYGLDDQRDANEIHFICDESPRPFTLVFEVVLAVYFFFDSIKMTYMTVGKMKREYKSIIFDVLINGASYFLYITLREYKEWKNRNDHRMKNGDS